MIRKTIWAALWLAFALCLLPGVVAAQEEEAEPQQEGEATETESGTISETELPDLDDIDEILEGDDEILAGRGYTYDPGDRRDPFESLVQNADTFVFDGPRPDGVPGLLIDEVVLSGIFKTRDGFMAQVQAAKSKKAYLIRKGDQLYDGDVVDVTATEVVFKQNVRDSSALKPFREVVKNLKP